MREDVMGSKRWLSKTAARRKITRQVGLAAATALMAGGLAATPAAAATTNDDRLTARYSVEIFNLPDFGSGTAGTIYQGHKYQTGQVVDGPRFPDGYCETWPQRGWWRSVVLPDGKIGYTSSYCIF
ncbi:hypothetical protein [Streptomyces sp. NPDC021212]|uniref:hypothetical protein n=1 Tax=Streptomyces sp. NPDC021212 TaxID=3365118 RepID=UPI00379C9031